MIFVENRRASADKLRAKYPNSRLVDLTSKATDQHVQFSPFFPHGGIPIPFSENLTSQSVEGVWQGLKVFQKEDVDLRAFENSTMKALKRTERRFGKCIGHRKGVGGVVLLTYLEARQQIYIPTYQWVLANHLTHLISELRCIAEKQTLVLLDYETNGNVFDLSKPLSHAQLVKAFLEDRFPAPPPCPAS